MKIRSVEIPNLPLQEEDEDGTESSTSSPLYIEDVVNTASITTANNSSINNSRSYKSNRSSSSRSRAGSTSRHSISADQSFISTSSNSCDDYYYDLENNTLNSNGTMYQATIRTLTAAMTELNDELRQKMSECEALHATASMLSTALQESDQLLQDKTLECERLQLRLQQLTFVEKSYSRNDDNNDDPLSFLEEDEEITESSINESGGAGREYDISMVEDWAGFSVPSSRPAAVLDQIQFKPTSINNNKIEDTTTKVEVDSTEATTEETVSCSTDGEDVVVTEKDSTQAEMDKKVHMNAASSEGKKKKSSTSKNHAKTSKKTESGDVPYTSERVDVDSAVDKAETDRKKGHQDETTENESSSRGGVSVDENFDDGNEDSNMNEETNNDTTSAAGGPVCVDDADDEDDDDESETEDDQQQHHQHQYNTHQEQHLRMYENAFGRGFSPRQAHFYHVILERDMARQTARKLSREMKVMRSRMNDLESKLERSKAFVELCYNEDTTNDSNKKTRHHKNKPSSNNKPAEHQRRSSAIMDDILTSSGQKPITIKTVNKETNSKELEVDNDPYRNRPLRRALHMSRMRRASAAANTKQESSEEEVSFSSSNIEDDATSKEYLDAIAGHHTADLAGGSHQHQHYHQQVGITFQL